MLGINNGYLNRIEEDLDGVIENLQYGLEDDEIVDNKCDDGKRMDHIVYSSLLAVCSKKMPHSYDVTDDSNEKWIEFMKPEFNANAN